MVLERLWRGLSRWLSLLAAGSMLVVGARPLPPDDNEVDGFSTACAQLSGQIITLEIASAVYQRPVATSVYLPPCYDQTLAPLPVIYLLHGAGTDQTQWPAVGVQTAADALIAQGAPPFVVVMPGAAYAANLDYEAFVLNDLIPGIEGQVLVSQAASGRAIGGISLGGYWALRTAFEHPDLFAAVGGHSAVTVYLAGPDSPAELAGNAPGLDRLKIALDVGDSDSLRPSAERLASTLQGRGLPVTLRVGPGGHNRTYWRAHTADYLRFYVDALTAPAEPRAPTDTFPEPHL